MKTIILSIGVLALIVNIIFGIILSWYTPFNCAVTSAIIVLNMIMLHLISVINLKDGFRVSLNVLFPLIFLPEFGLGAFAPERVEDNYSLVVILLLLLLQGSMLIITNQISKSVE